MFFSEVLRADKPEQVTYHPCPLDRALPYSNFLQGPMTTKHITNQCNQRSLTHKAAV